MMVATERFSSRVENYVQYRPHYPAELIAFLKEKCELTSDSVIADIGSGTGFLAELFLKNRNQVFGIEPNKEMREAGERLLREFPRFTSLAAKAEATALPEGSLDFVTAGQAFHWFDLESCRKEFARILRPGGWIVLVWNDRHTDTTPFLIAYEQLLRDFGTDYDQVNHKRVDVAVIREFFRAEPGLKVLPNHQHFDFLALKGRLLSSSYVPEAGRPGYEEMLVALKSLFDSHQQNGKVTFDYDTLVYYGRLA
jgi:SAM-dependent methyltransferase